MPNRDPVSPGRFYPADAKLLLEQLEACYRHPVGPGELPRPAGELMGASANKPPLALVVPHGALGHSGPVAAHAYGLLAAWASSKNGLLPGLLVLLGPDHLGRGAAVSFTSLSYMTPLGVIPTDEALIQRLHDRAQTEGLAGRISDAPSGHLEEHALENQIPFIQHLAWRLLGESAGSLPPRRGFPGLPRLAPITMAVQDLATAETLARLLDTVLPRDDTLLLATSDMSHCGPFYGNPPRSGSDDTGEIGDWCNEQSRLAVGAIEGMEPVQLIERFHEDRLSMCGLGCVATAIRFARLRGATSTQVLATSNSVEVASQWRGQVPCDGSGNVIHPWNLLFDVDPHNPVGFAAIALA